MKQCTYDCRPRIIPSVAGAVFWLVASILLLHEAATNGRGLIINGLISMEPGNASIFYTALAVGCLVMLVARGAQLRRYLRGAFSIQLDDEWVALPVSKWSMEAIKVPYSEIEAEFNEDGTSVVLGHAAGRLELAMDWFSNDDEFGRFVEELEEQLQSVSE